MFLARQAKFFEEYDAGTLNIVEYQRFSMGSNIKAGPTLARQELERFIELSVKLRLADTVFELIELHRQQGHHLLVITATNVFVSRAVVDALGIEDLLAINLAVDEQGWLNGEIEGTPSFMEGKVTRLNAWLLSQGLNRQDANLISYSDSVIDLPLLTFVDQPVATNPSPGLQAHAALKGWPLLNLV